MSKYRYIYCSNCKDFYLGWHVDFGDNSKACPSCYSKNIKTFESDTFSEMAQTERKYKISKIVNK